MGWSFLGHRRCSGRVQSRAGPSLARFPSQRPLSTPLTAVGHLVLGLLLMDSTVFIKVSAL